MKIIDQALVLEKLGRRSRQWMKWRSCTRGFPVLLGGDPTYHIDSIVPPSIGCSYHNKYLHLINTQDPCMHEIFHSFQVSIVMKLFTRTKEIRLNCLLYSHKYIVIIVFILFLYLHIYLLLNRKSYIYLYIVSFKKYTEIFKLKMYTFI